MSHRGSDHTALSTFGRHARRIRRRAATRLRSLAAAAGPDGSAGDRADLGDAANEATALTSAARSPRYLCRACGTTFDAPTATCPECAGGTIESIQSQRASTSDADIVENPSGTA